MSRRRAEEHWLAALALLADEHPDLDAAARHVQRGRALLGGSAPESEASGGRAMLLAEARALGRALRSGDDGAALRRARRRRWALRGAGLAAALAVLAMVVLNSSPPPRPWLGSYYSSERFGGEPVVRADEDVYFDWRKRAPAPGVRRDRFSARWESCLGLPAPATFEFRLQARGGVRLFIDGTMAIDAWRHRPGPARPITLDEGIHHLRVDFADRGGDASIFLTASIDGGRFGPLPPGMLQSPTGPATDPCNTGIPIAAPPGADEP